MYTAVNATSRIFEKCEVLQDILVLRFESISRELEEEKKKTEENNKQTQELLHQILNRLTDIETSLPAKKKAFFGK